LKTSGLTSFSVNWSIYSLKLKYSLSRHVFKNTYIL
jgi:hypothetical protein